MHELAAVATEAAVPILRPYLVSSQWCDAARGALETLQHPAAAAAMRQAAESTTGRPLAGLLDSLGRRRDEATVSLAARHLADADPDVAAAAARALARIANNAAIRELVGAAVDPQRPPSTPLIEALWSAADELLRRGGPLQSILPALDALGTPPRPANAIALRVRAATNSGADAVALVRTESNPAVGLAAAHLLRRGELAAPPSLSADLLADLPTPLRDALLAAVIRHRPESVDTLLLELASDSRSDLRNLALSAIGRWGRAAALPRLWELARTADSPDSDTARRSLEGFPGEAADHFLVQWLNPAGAPADIALALELLGRRAWAPAADAMVRLTGHGDPAVRVAAVSALRDVGTIADMLALLSRWSALQAPAEISAAERTLLAVIARRHGTDPAAPLIAAISNALQTAAVPARPPLLRALHRVGGPAAAAVVIGATSATDPEVRDTAARLLTEWPDIHALDWLTAVAHQKGAGPLQQLALRAALGWTAAGDRPLGEKAERLLAFEPLLATDDDRRAFLAALGQVPCAASLHKARAMLSGQLADEAAAAILSLAAHPSALPPQELRKALEEAAAAPVAPELRRSLRQRLVEISRSQP
ncbi:MAG: hypothetical protein N2652_00185 [Kiritimatiellae bacterium]|nr:hypothetical protein [Kiritimatiellia bacterium]